MDAVAALTPGSGLITAACAALGLSRASLHRRQAFRRQPLAAVRPRPTPMRALVANERQVVLDLLREPRFVDLAPAEVCASLLDRGVYLCSIRTMYRVLAEHDEVRERRRQLRRPVYQKPELLAEGPNQVWSWDITKLMGPAKWSYFYLYVIIDIFSRRIVAWCIADAESAALFKPLFDDAVVKHNVAPGQLTCFPKRRWKSIRTSNAIERLHEELKRRIKTQTVLPSAETAAMLFWALLASGQITMRKVDGWRSLNERPSDQTIDLAA